MRRELQNFAVLFVFKISQERGWYLLFSVQRVDEIKSKKETK